MGIILVIIFVAIAAALGSSKGYSGALCGVAGFFGGLIAIIVIAILPDKNQEREEAARRESSRNNEITALKKRIRDLEAAQRTASPSFPENGKGDGGDADGQ